MLTYEQLDEIKTRASKATRGPWSWEGSIYEHMEAEIVAARGLAQLWESDNVIPDADFIAHARTDIPDLIAALEAAERERDDAQKALRTVQNAAKTLAHSRDSELQHLRENSAYDHKLRAEHDSLIERDALMTARVTALEVALSYYAKEHKNPSEGPWGLTSTDFGNVARHALEPKAMTKQVFDQIAEGLREAAETPPAWAMEKAREVVSRFMISSYYSEYKSTVAIARALAEADKAATERERERCAKIADDKLTGEGQIVLAAYVTKAIRGAGQ